MKPKNNHPRIPKPGTIPRQLHDLRVSLERMKSRQQTQEQLNDELAQSLNEAERELKHMRAVMVAAGQDIGDLAGHDEAIQRLQTEVGFVAGVLRKRMEEEEKQEGAKSWDKALTAGAIAMCAGSTVYFALCIFGYGRDAGWW